MLSLEIHEQTKGENKKVILTKAIEDTTISDCKRSWFLEMDQIASQMYTWILRFEPFLSKHVWYLQNYLK